MFVGNEKKDEHLDRLLRLEKSTSVHKKAGESIYFFLRVYLSEKLSFFYASLKQYNLRTWHIILGSFKWCFKIIKMYLWCWAMQLTELTCTSLRVIIYRKKLYVYARA